MKDIKWIEGNCIQIDPPKKTKKITGTRFATILGLNPWSTEFEIWCAITKTYEAPFEDTVYTVAGKVIEPKQADYMKKSYGMDIITPENVYGKNYFKKTSGDFFKENTILGGMWDYLCKDENGKVDTVLEMKTTKRAEDWQDNIPEYYALQAALYAYLLGVDDVIMVASFLEESDYEHPEDYQPSIQNTITVDFKLSQRYPDFAEKVARVKKWWNDHVVTGISPAFDEKKDAEILKVLRTNTLSPDTDIQTAIAEAEQLKQEIDAVTATISDKTERLSVLNNLIKAHAIDQFRDGDKKVELTGTNYKFSISRTEGKSSLVYNDKAMLADGVYDKYVTTKSGAPTYRLTVSTIESEETNDEV